MISKTFELRAAHGRFTAIDPEKCDGFHHASSCQACGSSRPEHLYGVQAGDLTLLVGSQCAGILTSAKLPKVDAELRGTGETYQDGDKTFVYPTSEWVQALAERTYVNIGKPVYSRFTGTITPSFENRYSGATYTSEFLHSLVQRAMQTGKLSQKQFDAAERN